MNMRRKVKNKLILILIISTIIIPIYIGFAEDDYIIIRVVDANYPPKMRVNEEENYTRFGLDLHYQIENPTQSPVNVTYSCAPYPFPLMNIKLRNKSLEVKQLFIVEWVFGNKLINPGIRNNSIAIAFEIYGHTNLSLPQGNYEFWLDYTNCSYVLLPVITEKMYIDVTETNITYYFDYNDESRVVSSLQQTYYPESLLVFTFLFGVNVYRRRNRRKR